MNIAKHIQTDQMLKYFAIGIEYKNDLVLSVFQLPNSISIANFNFKLQFQFQIEIVFKNDVMYILYRLIVFQLPNSISIANWNLKLQFQFAIEIDFKNDVMYILHVKCLPIA